jgi:hypothetical protein
MPPVAPKALRNRSNEHILELVLELANDLCSRSAVPTRCASCDGVMQTASKKAHQLKHWLRELAQVADAAGQLRLLLSPALLDLQVSNSVKHSILSSLILNVSSHGVLYH